MIVSEEEQVLPFFVILVKGSEALGDCPVKYKFAELSCPLFVLELGLINKIKYSVIIRNLIS